MKRLSRFEVDCLVDVIESKVKEIEREKLVKECSEKVKEWNDVKADLNIKLIN